MDNPAATKIKYTSQEIDNMAFDETYGTKVTEIFDTPRATKITTSGSITYIATAPVGSSQASAVWRAQKIDETTGTVITWADSGNYTQVATNLASLTYA
jgi:hypothetical protein